MDRIVPFGVLLDATLSGSIFFRILNASEPVGNLRCIIETTFGIPQFESTQVAVITFYQVPRFFSEDLSIVSYQTHL